MMDLALLIRLDVVLGFLTFAFKQNMILRPKKQRNWWWKLLIASFNNECTCVFSLVAGMKALKNKWSMPNQSSIWFGLLVSYLHSCACELYLNFR